MTYSEEYQDCLLYIDSYWDRVTFRPAKKTVNHHVITIPNIYISPNDKRFDYIFYWDTYFMFRGLMGTRREWILKKMVENFAYIFKQYGIIPNFNSYASTGNSQPPFFSSMILDTYFTSLLPQKGIIKKIEKKFHPFLGSMVVNKRWLSSMIAVAKLEYWNYWKDGQNLENFKIGAKNHTVDGFTLSKYGDKDAGYALNAERESGWDFTSRFYNRCNEFLPIDLNCFLLKYENDFAEVAALLQDTQEKVFWEEKVRLRIEEINKYMWSKKEGFYYDYGLDYKQTSEFLSLAAFMPMWVGMATYEQARQMVQKLPIFEGEYGLFIDAKESLAAPIDLTKIQKRYHPAIKGILEPKQWDYPMIWPPLEYLVVIGLLKYGFVDDAARIMRKSLLAQAGIFREYGEFYEKMDGVTGDRTRDFHYPNQGGFGWTNAIFYRYVKILDFIESFGTASLYIDIDKTPPYSLAIIH